MRIVHSVLFPRLVTGNVEAAGDPVPLSFVRPGGNGAFCSLSRTLWVWMVLAVLAAGILEAQSGTAILSGYVTDPSGSAVPAAKVVLRSTLQTLSRETATDVTGGYVISLIPPGQYELEVDGPGFQRTTIEDIRLFSGQATTLAFAHPAWPTSLI